MNTMRGFLVAVAAVAAAASPTVNIGAGTLEGGVCANNANSVYFKSIPFAEPPVDDLRFAAPKQYTQAYEGGSRNATQPAPSCIQFSEEFAEANNTSEDWYTYPITSTFRI